MANINKDGLDNSTSVSYAENNIENNDDSLKIIVSNHDKKNNLDDNIEQPVENHDNKTEKTILPRYKKDKGLKYYELFVISIIIIFFLGSLIVSWNDTNISLKLWTVAFIIFCLIRITAFYYVPMEYNFLKNLNLIHFIKILMFTPPIVLMLMNSSASSVEIYSSILLILLTIEILAPKSKNDFTLIFFVKQTKLFYVILMICGLIFCIQQYGNQKILTFSCVMLTLYIQPVYLFINLFFYKDF